MDRPGETTHDGPRRPSTAVDLPSCADDAVDLACDDLVNRWRRGDRRPVEWFCESWSDGPPRPDVVFELIYTEYRIREEMGESALEDLARRFPDHANRLRHQVAMHELLFDSVDTEAAEMVDTATLPGSSTESAPAAWASLRGYEFKRVLGRGGMGVVYEARQVRLNRPVALKMIRSGVHASPEDRTRFLAEAEAIARLRHPNIVQVYAFGDSDGQPYFEMEFVDGGSLGDRLDGTPHQPRAASTFLEIVARAIHEAHRRGVVHRDLKPSNILLMADGSPKIVDFGLAKLIGSESGLTRTDSVLGSPAYMAPEQAFGLAKDVGPAADVYALGAIYYEMLTGRPPFVAESTLEVLELARNAEPVPPSRLRPGLPRDVETICLRCLSKEPTRRYATAEALADDLGRWLRGESIRARPTGFLERSYRWSLRNRAVAGLVASIVLLLIGGATGMGVLWARARTEASNAAHLSASLVLDRGIALAEAGEAGRGLPFMAQAARLDPGRLGGAARANLAAWSPLIPKPIRSTRLNAKASWVAFSPDRRISLIGGMDGSLAFWDNDRFALIHETGPRPGGRVARILFRRDGLVVASFAEEAGTVQAWDVLTGRPIGSPLAMNPKGSARLAFRPDGSILAAATGPFLRLWDLERDRPACEPISESSKISDLAFSPDGSNLVIITQEYVERRDGRNGEILGERIRLDGTGCAIAFHPDGSHFAVGFGPSTLSKQSGRRASGVQRFETATGKPLGTLLPHRVGVKHVAYRSDGQVLLSGDPEGIARLWDAKGQPIGELLRNEAAIETIEFSPDGAIALTRSEVGPARLWDVATASPIGAALEHPTANLIGFAADGDQLIAIGEDHLQAFDVTGMIAPARTPRSAFHRIAFLPDGRSYVGTTGAVAQIISTADGRSIGWPMSHHNAVNLPDPAAIQVVAVSPDARSVATGGRDATVRIWDEDGCPTVPPIPIQHWASALCFSPNGRRLLAADEAGDVCLIDVETGKLAGPPWHHPSRFVGSHVERLFFSKDGKIGYSVENSGTIGRVDGTTGRPLGEFFDYPLRIHDCSPSADARSLLVISGESIRVIDLADGRERVAAFGKGVHSACFSADCRTIISGGADKLIRFWDADSGIPSGPPISLPNPVKFVVASPDGRILQSVGEDGQSRTWDLAGRKQVGPSRFLDPSLPPAGFSPDGRLLAGIDQATQIDPIPAPEAAVLEDLTGRISTLTGLGLDKQGGIEFRCEAAFSVNPKRPPPSRPGADTDWHARAGIVLGFRGDHAAALWHFDRHLAAHPDDWRAHALRSDVLSRLGRVAESAAEADRARALAGPLQAARWDVERAFTAYEEKRWDDAIAAFDRALAFEPPGRSIFREARGWAKAQVKDWAGASADLAAGTWRTYSMLSDSECAVLVALAAGDGGFYRDLIAGLIRPDEDRRLLDKPRVASRKAWLGALVPDAQVAPDLLVRLAEPAALTDNGRDVLDSWITLGMAFYRAGRFEEAIDRLTQVHQGNRLDESFEARIILAMSQQRLGHTREARAWLDLATHQGMNLHGWKTVSRMILHREAEKIVGDSGFPSDPSQ